MWLRKIYQIIKNINANLYKQSFQKITMAFALIRIKVMPDSPSADLDSIESNIKNLLEEAGSKSIKFEREPIAFGLTAVISQFSWDDSESNDELMEKIQQMDHVSSAEIIDYRRAIG